MDSIVINDRLMSGCTVVLYGDQFVLSDVNDTHVSYSVEHARIEHALAIKSDLTAEYE